MPGVLTQPTYRDVVLLNNAGRYIEALTLLDSLPDTGIHLWLRGWALHHSGRREEAHAALGAAQAQLAGDNLGRMWMDWAVLFGHERRFARAYDLHVRAWQLLRHDEVMRPLVLYNLGWQHLSRLQLDLARARLFEAMEAGERAGGAGALERVVTRVGVSTLERLSGHPRVALERAAWAQEVAGEHRHANLPWRAQAQAYRHLGELDRARAAQASSLELAPAGPYQAGERLMLGLIDRAQGAPVQLEALRTDVLPLDLLRLELHLADEARLAGREHEALARLRAVVALDEPYPLRDEAPALTDLYTLGRAAGLALPVWRPEQVDRQVVLRALGTPSLRVGGGEVPVTSSRTFALLVYLAMYGQTTLDVLGHEVFPGMAARQVRARVRASLGVVGRWLGDPGAVTLHGQLVVPSGRWAWRVDVTEVLAGHAPLRGAFLPGLYSDWTGRLQALLDAQARDES